MSEEYKGEISLKDVWLEAFRNKWIIISTSFIFGVASIFIALKLPNIYQSNIVLVANSEDQGGLSSLAKSFGGLTSLTGIGLGQSAGPDKAMIALEILKSQEFITQFIRKYNLVVPLIAAIGSDPLSYELILDEDIYDLKNKRWIRDVKPPKSIEPSSEEIYKKFLKILRADQDVKTGFIKASIEFYSPDLAKLWLELIVTEINTLIKNNDKKEAERSIVYLNQALSKTKNSSMQSTFYQLIEEQTKTLMLAEAREEYIFKTISPAAIPEKKIKPRRALIVLAGLITGGMLSLFIIFIRYFIKKDNE
jgi:uncharacterized protein involved in exopolysaccharide biosynthesis